MQVNKKLGGWKDHQQFGEWDDERLKRDFYKINFMIFQLLKNPSNNKVC
jgi:hypothetical protein